MEKEPVTKESIARKFALGQILDIEVQDVGKTRFQGTLLGMKEGRYLVTDLPSLTQHGNLRDRLLDDQELIVRTICEKTTGECLGFKSYIHARLKVPDQLLFITFPPDVRIHELRNEKRLLVSLSATAQIVGRPELIRSTLTDLSAGGCRFEFMATEKNLMQRDTRVQIEFKHPESGQALSKPGTVRSVRYINDLCSVGMAFDKA